MDSELWSSKALDLDWRSASPTWHSPMLSQSADGSWKWFWRIDVTFGAWATRTLTRARAAGARLPGEPEKSLVVIRAYLEESDPGSLLRVDTLAAAPVKLSGDELILDADEFARWGWVPRAA